MNINGKLSGDLVSLHIKANDSNDGKEANVDFDCLVDKAKATELLGEDFEQLAFGSMQTIANGEEDSGQTIRHLQDSIKPGKKVVFEKHSVLIAGHKVDVQPVLRGIATRQGSEEVIVKLRIPIGVSETALLKKLLTQVNDVVEIEFDPAQGDMFAGKGEPEQGSFGDAASTENPAAAH